MSDEKVQKRQLQYLVTPLIIGGTAGSIVKTLLAPLERVKLLLQTQDSNAKIIASGRKYKGIVDCFTRVVAEEGPKELWRGNWANVIRYFPTQALNFACNDFYKKTFCPYNPNTDFWKFFAGNLVSGGAAGASAGSTDGWRVTGPRLMRYTPMSPMCRSER